MKLFVSQNSDDLSNSLEEAIAKALTEPSVSYEIILTDAEYSVDSPIKIDGANFSESNKVTIKSETPLGSTINGGLEITNSSWITISGININTKEPAGVNGEHENFGAGGIGNALKIESSNNITVEHSALSGHNITLPALHADQEEYPGIKFDPDSGDPKDVDVKGGTGIRLKDVHSVSIIDNNFTGLKHGVQFEQLDENASDKEVSTSNTIANNHFENIRVDGVRGTDHYGTKVTDNFFGNFNPYHFIKGAPGTEPYDHSDMIQFYANEAQFGVNNLTIESNILFDPDSTMVKGIFGDIDPGDLVQNPNVKYSNFTIHNNLIILGSTGGIQLDGVTGSNSITNNTLISNGLTRIGDPEKTDHPGIFLTNVEDFKIHGNLVFEQWFGAVAIKGMTRQEMNDAFIELRITDEDGNPLQNILKDGKVDQVDNANTTFTNRETQFPKLKGLTEEAELSDYYIDGGASVGSSLIYPMGSVISGTDDNDTLSGDDDADLISGYAGDDFLKGGDGADRIFGGVGDDRLIGGAGNDLINGDAGNDRLNGEAGMDTLNGGGGDDQLNSGDDDDLINGDAGNDRLLGKGGNDTLNGDEGNDTIYGGLGNDILRGGANDDRLAGDDGNDTLEGGEGADRLLGQLGDDLLKGGGENDTLLGEAGNDTLNGGGGNDQLNSGENDDLINGDAGNDRLLGKGGNDTLNGGADIDTLQGGDGDDQLDGGDGADRLEGENGSDTVTGGAGADQFIWAHGADTNGDADVITDLDFAEDRLLIKAFGTNLNQEWVDSAAELYGLDFTGLTVVEVGGGTLITVDEGTYSHSLLLEGISDPFNSIG